MPSSKYSIQRELFLSKICELLGVDEETAVSDIDTIDLVQRKVQTIGGFTYILSTFDLVNEGKTETVNQFIGGIDSDLGARWAWSLQFQSPGED